MKLQKIGTPILAAGAIILLGISWLFSWWYVRPYREMGPGAVSPEVLFGGTRVFMLWASSAPLGAVLAVTGAGIAAGCRGIRLALTLIVSMLLVLWLALWSFAPRPAVFGIGGGLITVCFLYSTVRWGRSRPHLVGKMVTATDLRMAGHLLFFIGAWGLCGLLGPPVFATQPQLMRQAQGTSAAADVAMQVLVCLALGWACIALGQHLERDSKK